MDPEVSLVVCKKTFDAKSRGHSVQIGFRKENQKSDFSEK